MTTDDLKHALEVAASKEHTGNLRVILHQSLCACKTLAKEIERLRGDLKVSEAMCLLQDNSIRRLQTLLHRVDQRISLGLSDPTHGDALWHDVTREAAEAAGRNDE